MPSIDYQGRYHCHARAKGKRTRGAIAFPIKASTAGVARRFADKTVLALLPGWTIGRVVLTRDGKRVDSWALCRPA